MAGVVLAGLTPHPPVIVPEIGRDRLGEVGATVRAVRKWAAAVARAAPDAVVVVGPHGPALRGAVPVVRCPLVRGSFAAFGEPRVTIEWPCDLELAGAVLDAAAGEGVSAVGLDEAGVRRNQGTPELDHGTMVPLYFLREAKVRAPLVQLGLALLPYRDLFRFGTAVAAAARAAGRRAVVIASGDLSHRLIPGAPAGYHPRGKEFDRELVAALGHADAQALFSLDPDLIEAAGECGLRPAFVLLGSLAGRRVTAEVLSYEGPFGVGYAVISLEPEPEDVAPSDGTGESYPVRLARRSLEHYVRGLGVLPLPDDAPAELLRPAATFVSLKKDGRLRGCIGTVQPTQGTAAEEILYNAISAATRDPRFPPLTPGELAGLAVSVDILTPAEPVDGPRQLDPRRYGVIVRRGPHSGLLLPDLEGVDTVEEQLDIACRKAGIDPGAPGIELYRFEVVRYH
jgi:AmmeMemoRadiSam system protein A